MNTSALILAPCSIQQNKQKKKESGKLVPYMPGLSGDGDFEAWTFNSDLSGPPAPGDRHTEVPGRMCSWLSHVLAQADRIVKEYEEAKNIILSLLLLKLDGIASLSRHGLAVFTLTDGNSLKYSVIIFSDSRLYLFLNFYFCMIVDMPALSVSLSVDDRKNNLRKTFLKSEMLNFQIIISFSRTSCSYILKHSMCNFLRCNKTISLQ